MSKKRILGLVLVIAGGAMLLFSNYIMGQVGEGKKKISSAESKVKTGNSLFSMSPYTKDLGEGLSNSANKKIAAGKQQVGYYEDLAEKLKMGGLVLAGLGVLLLLFGGKKKSHSR